MGLCWKCLGGGRDYIHICALLKLPVLCWSSRSIFSLVDHWCFLVFTLPPEFGFWQCRHFWTWSIFQLLASFGLLIPFRGHLLPPREAQDGFYDCAAAVPCCHSEDGWGISKLEVGALFRRTHKAVAFLSCFALAFIGKALNTGPYSALRPQAFVGPSLPQPFPNCLIHSGSAESAVKRPVPTPPHLQEVK